MSVVIFLVDWAFSGGCRVWAPTVGALWGWSRAVVMVMPRCCTARTGWGDIGVGAITVQVPVLVASVALNQPEQ